RKLVDGGNRLGGGTPGAGHAGGRERQRQRQRPDRRVCARTDESVPLNEDWGKDQETGSRQRPPSPGSGRWSRFVQERLTARRAARRRFELLDAAFHLIQSLVGLLRGLIGGFGALGRALHPRVELVEPRVDPCELVVIGGAGAEAQGDNDRQA